MRLRLIQSVEITVELMRNKLDDDAHDETATELAIEVENNDDKEGNKERSSWKKAKTLNSN